MWNTLKVWWLQPTRWYFIKSIFKYLKLFKNFHNALTNIRIKYILDIKM